MPNYSTPQAGGTLTALQPGDSAYLFNAETPAPPQASIAIARGYSPAADDAGITFQVISPGTFNCVIQASNLDVDADYINLSPAITTSPASLTDTQRFAFYRAKVTSLTGGSITVIAQR